MIKKLLPTAILIFVSLNSLNAQTADAFLSYLPSSAQTALQEDGYSFRYKTDDATTKYLPASPQKNIITNKIKEIQPNVFLEGIYKFPLLAKTTSKEDTMLQIFNALLDFQELDGALYFSHGEKKYTELFSEVYRVESPKNRKKLENIQVSSLPNVHHEYIHLKEKRLGKGIYALDYAVAKSTHQMTFSLTNATAMKFIFTVVDPEEMNVNLQIFVLDDAIIVYTTTIVQFKNMTFVSALMDPYSSFQRRTQSYVTWLQNSLYQTNNKPPKTAETTAD